MNKMEVKIISKQQTYDLRKRILRKNIDKPYQFDGDDALTTIHFGSFDNSKLVGICTMMQRNNPTIKVENQYQLRGMAVNENYQGKGVGAELLKHVISYMKSQKTPVIWCNARIKAVRFYEREGFEIISEPFEIKQIGTHYVMVKNLVG